MKQLLIVFALLLSASAHAQNLYGDMENWRSVYPSYGPPVSLESPIAWYDTDSLIFMANYFFPTAQFSKQSFKTTDAHSGSYAVKLLTVHQDTFGMMAALLSNGLPVADSLMADPTALVGGTHFYGGTVVSQRVNSLDAWIKYLPNGADTAAISIKAVLSGQASGGQDSLIGSGSLLVSQSYTTYTSVSVPVNYINNAVPKYSSSLPAAKRIV